MRDKFRRWLAWRLPPMKEKFWMWLAWRLPKKLVYFATIRLHAHATCTKYSDKHPNEVSIMQSLEHWERS